MMSKLRLAVVLLVACAGDAPVTGETATGSGTFGVMVEPRLGRVVDGDPATATLAVAGVHERARYRIDIQVPADPTSLSSWVTLAQVQTDATASATDPTMHEWHATIAPAAIDPRRWPAGGVLHVRAIGEAGEVLGVLFDDADPCIAGATGWQTRAEQCGAQLDGGAVVVNAAASPLDVAMRPRLLDLRGTSSDADTLAYYTTIAAPATLADFRTTYGFADGDVTATYYNAGDLGIGRGMHCRTLSQGGVACYVSNYGAFGGDPDDAIDRAVTGELAGGTGSFAAVAMVYTPPLSAPNAVQFMVYGATGKLVTTAQLDRYGDNTSIPNNCMNCHGAGASYDSVNHVVRGAHFLPFDPGAFAFSRRAGFTSSDQADALRRLDSIVSAAGPTAAPDGWNATVLDRAVYRNVIGVTCRGCHATRDDRLAFTAAADLRGYAAAAADAVCGGQHTMPNAEVPLERLWRGPGRAYLVAYLGTAGACSP